MAALQKVFLSPSTLNLYRECPRCFYLHMRYEIKRPRGPMPSIATGLDSVFKKYFAYYRSIGELPPDLKQEMSGHLIEKLKPTYYYNIRPGYTIIGKLDDCLVTDEGRYVPLDHKTRASPASGVHPAYQLQMEVYCLLLDGNGLKAGDRAYLIYYYPLNVSPEEGPKNITFGLDIKRVDVDVEHAREVIRQAIDCLKSPEIPEPSPECEYCRWVDEAGAKGAAAGESERVLDGKPSREKKTEEPEGPPEEEEYKDSLFE
jgi:hypothetical protein